MIGIWCAQISKSNSEHYELINNWVSRNLKRI